MCKNDKVQTGLIEIWKQKLKAVKGKSFSPNDRGHQAQQDREKVKVQKVCKNDKVQT